MDLQDFTLLLGILQTVQFTRAVVAVQTSCSSQNVLNAACFPLDVSVNSLCTLEPAACNGSADMGFSLSKVSQCGGGDQSRAVSEVSSLVMYAAPQCGTSHYYDIWSLWENTNSNYKIVLRDNAGDDEWTSHYACVYDGHTATFNNHETTQGGIRIQVMTHEIDQSVQNFSVYNVQVEARLPDAARSSTTYSVYSDSSGRKCEQLYTPLGIDKIRATANWESETGEDVQVDVRWCSSEDVSTSHNHSYIVAIGSGNCTIGNRNPPCILVQNSSRVSIGPFPWHGGSDIAIRVYRMNTTYCSSREVNVGLVHLFRGCDEEDCCERAVTVPILSSVTMSMTSAAGSGALTTMSSQTTPCFTDPHTTFPISSTGRGTGSRDSNTSTSSTSANQTGNSSLWIPFVAIAVAIVIFGTVVLVILLAYFAAKRKMWHSSSLELSKKSKPPPLSDSATLAVIVHNRDNSYSQGTQLLTSHGDSSHVSTPTSVESSEPLLSASGHRALVIYSPSTPEEKQELIRGHLLSQLHSYGIETLSHDLTCIKESPSLWLEREIAMATIVICVCNKEFKHDWECERNGTSSLPIVQSLNHLIYASINQNKDMSKYAVVLLEEGDKDCVPTMYLQSHSRQFMVYDVDKIARFVCNIPTHVTSSSE